MRLALTISVLLNLALILVAWNPVQEIQKAKDEASAAKNELNKVREELSTMRSRVPEAGTSQPRREAVSSHSNRKPIGAESSDQASAVAERQKAIEAKKVWRAVEVTDREGIATTITDFGMSWKDPGYYIGPEDSAYDTFPLTVGSGVTHVPLTKVDFIHVEPPIPKDALRPTVKIPVYIQYRDGSADSGFLTKDWSVHGDAPKGRFSVKISNVEKLDVVGFTEIGPE